ncbi:MAG: Crp/Fnr family transcriptional regulator [Anaerolineae bacterium]|nr:Crp/Fnr family transcriptional regulator [Anaerolineae bacterium]
MGTLLHSNNKGPLAEKLRAHRYFHHLAESRLQWLAINATCYRFEPGEIILLDGAPSAGLWLVHEGHVKVYKTSAAGDEHIVHFVGPGESFNDVAVMDGGPNPASAAALSPLTTCNFPREIIVEAIRADPDLAMSLIQSLAARTRFLVDQVEELALYSVTTRVARFLVKQEEDAFLNAASAVNRATLASHLAIKPETLSRALSALETSGAISVSRTSLTVTNAELLRVVALL